MNTFFVSVVFETYRQMNKKTLLSKRGFVGLCNEIIAHFDLIAPYYKFCGDSKMRVLMLEEDAKHQYRERAKLILQQKAIFKEGWMKLHQEFLEEFYRYR